MTLSAAALCYGPSRSLRLGPVAIDLEPGRLTCLVGPNGSGKSSLVRTMAGVLAPHAGDVRLNRQSLTDLSRRDLARRIAYVPQMTGNAPVSVYDVIMMGRTPYFGFRPGKRDVDAVRAAMDRLGLCVWSSRPFDELSGGERQKVLIGRALAQNAPVLLLDEPTTSLDIRYQTEIYGLLLDLCRTEGRTILCVEHNLDLALRYAAAVAVLDHGRIAALGPPVTTLTPAILKTVFGVNAIVDADRRVIVVAAPDHTAAISSIIN